MPRIRRFCCDDETGEIITHHVNNETGEPVLPQTTHSMSMRVTNARPQNKIEPIKFTKGYVTNTRKFRSLKANIIAGSHTFSYRLFLIPAAALFPNLASMLLMILEIFLHVQCHKKNKSLKNTKLYYRSPFHIITSVFCGVCRENDAASRIEQLQDERRHRYHYIRGMAL
ncbi:uncharacterized protein LOC113520753 [Galleria mellonella]|uniref:Uncharacterized protein LOC113520753 n=1 Tax=Galleria mellonella TaxID=7137 RepID=A0A6J1WZN6_GALME|nr:uncharacterized protein LOC113520753 [Galleria mellonella]